MSFFGKSDTAQRKDMTLFHILGTGAELPRSEFVALAPGANAPLLPLDLPPGLKGQTRERVAKRQLTDAYGGSAGGAEIRLADLSGTKKLTSRGLVAAGRDRQAWCDEVKSAEGLCRAILPDYLALPTAVGCWTLEATDGVIRARLGPEDGFTAEPDLALSMLEVAYRVEPPNVVLRLGAYSPLIDGFISERNLKLADSPDKIAAMGLPKPLALVHGEMSLDLSREPGADAAALRNALRPYRLTAVMGLLALALWSGSVILETRELREQALTYRRNAESILRETMIPAGPILDIRAQVTKLMDDRRQSEASKSNETRPLDVLAAAGGILSGDDVRVTRVGYQSNGGLLIDLQVADFASLDELVLNLRETGINLNVAQSGTRENEGVGATLALGLEVRRGSQ